MKANVYIEEVESDLERLLSNMDRNRGSDTFGCLSRPYWHDKITDFPSAHQQIGIFPLTLAYTQEWDGNPFYNQEKIKQCIHAGLKFWARIQKKNGSFDEHYPNEHSLGAIAWSLWAVTESYLLLEDPPEIEENIKKAVEILEQKDEPGEIANHQAVSAAALVNAHQITGKGIDQAKNRIENLKEMQNSEGWFQEYIGADIGYQSTTISHLGRVWRHDSDLVDREVIEKALEFFSNFIDEDNYYSGIIGSRNTEHIHSAGFEILAEDFDKSKKIAEAIRRNKDDDNLLSPRQMDDKHFSRQLAEYMDAYRYSSDEHSECNQITDIDYKTILVKSSGSRRIYINTSKGGIYKTYSEGELVEVNTGISIKKNGSIYTANWPGITQKVKLDSNRISLEGKLRKANRNTLPHYYFLAFRAFNYTLGRSSWLSLKMKNFLISKLIGSNSNKVDFKREIIFGEEFEVSDEVEGDRISGKVRSNFVPSSEFFSLEKLEAEMS